MALWCSGGKSFNESIQQITPVSSLEQNVEKTPRDGDVLIIDLDYEHQRDPLKTVKEWANAGSKVIVACNPKTMRLATRAVKQGAQQIALKPIQAEDLEGAIASVPIVDLDRDGVEQWRKRYAAEIVGSSPALFEALEIAMQAADCDCPILITGESGTGKELLARAFHRASPRTKNPFVPVNCPAIPKELVESELFGHTKGAFTGATMSRLGRFAAADGGTLFLDEIGEMSHDIQCKLLRVLQDYQITRVGESRSQKVDVRIVAATNRDLEEMVGKGSFREDLYYRLNVIQVHLPPLRERREDIPTLVDHFLHTIAKQRGLPAPQLTSRVRDALMSYHWPGNIRQLRNIVERLVILRRGRSVEIKHLPACVVRGDQTPRQENLLFEAFQLPAEGINLRDTLQRFESSMIKQALMSTNGNKNRAAKILGLNRTTLVEKLRKQAIKVA